MMPNNKVFENIVSEPDNPCKVIIPVDPCTLLLQEAAPLDHPFSAVKRQQQKRWLEDLNKQREEDALRKMEEKQKFQEVFKV